MADGQTRHLFGERPTCAVRGVAEEPAHPQVHHQLLAADRAVRHPPLVAAVHARRLAAATRARRNGGAAAGEHPHRAAYTRDMFDDQAGEVRKQDVDRIKDSHPS